MAHCMATQNNNMTTYIHTITLDDCETIAIKAALNLLIQHCQEKLDEGATAPYWAHKESAQKILDKLYDNTFQTSGNNFFD